MVRLAVEGKSHSAIADWIACEYGERVTRRAVSRRLMTLRSERSEAAQAIVTEKLAVQVSKDIDIFSDQQRILTEDAARLRKAAGLDGGDKAIDLDAAEVYLKAIARLESVTDRKLHYSGADGGENKKAPESAGQDFLDKLDRLIRREAEPAEAPLH